MFKIGNMKKIFIIILSIFGLISCDPINNEKTNSTFYNIVEIPLINGPDNNNIKIYVIKFNYNNHQYIMFAPYASLQNSTVVHDPDCPCLKQ
jgi:hypothetical protein